MSQHIATQSKNYKSVENQVRRGTPEFIIDSASLMMDRIDECKSRIDKEGSVVRDMKGSVIEHPAISIELKEIKALNEILSKWLK